MKKYRVKKIFGPTIQGEGSLCGSRTVFVRFAGCNAWSGREEDKASSLCPFCDTDFVGGSQMSKDEILDEVDTLSGGPCLITFSGGEPALQLDEDIVGGAMFRGHSCAIETNGTVKLSQGLRHSLHVTCSPKVPIDKIKLEDCDDLKILYPHPNKSITPESFASFPAKRRWIQPVNDVVSINENALRSATEKVLSMKEYGLSVQLHKLIGVE